MSKLKERKQRLEGLASEVDDLHPMLEVLFKKMPGIAEVRYTHGQREYGADFVLKKHDEATQRDRYVGIVAKLGGITQSGLSEIDRQIEECRLLERPAEHGMKRIRIGEVWVVAAGTISGNAKEKIQAKHAGSAIEFFDCDDLVEKIDRFAPFLWQRIPSVVGQYLVELEARLVREERDSQLLGSDLEIPEIELECSPVDIEDFKPRKRSKRESVRLEDEVRTRALTIVQGEMGSGKSHMLRSLAKKLCALEAFEKESILPIHVSYRRFVDEYGGSLERCVDAQLGVARGEAMRAVTRMVVVLDGLDEVRFEGGDLEDPVPDLLLQAQALQGVSVVIGTRPRPVSAGKWHSSPSIRLLEIRPLTVGKILQFIRSVCSKGKLPSRFADDVNRSDLFRQLPQNPIAAQLLSRLLLENRDELPQTLTELYKKSMEQMLGRWDERKGVLASQQEYDVSSRVFFSIAERVVRERAPLIPIGEVERILDGYLRERNLVVDKARVLQRVFARSGILVRDDENGTACFRHRSFAEFFFAQSNLARESLGPDASPYGVYWSNAFFFWLGLKADCRDELSRVIATPCTTTDERLGRMLMAPQYLMAAYLTPYEVTTKAVAQLLLEAAELFEDLKSKPLNSPIQRLSGMQVLWIIAYLTRMRYGYRFFLPAIEDAVTSIELGDGSRRTKGTALFLGALAALDMGSEAPLQMLVDEYKYSELPIEVVLALSNEGRLRAPSKLTRALRGYGKRLRDSVGSSPGGRDRFESLFQQPIAERLASQDRKSMRAGNRAPSGVIAGHSVGNVVKRSSRSEPK